MRSYRQMREIGQISIGLTFKWLAKEDRSEVVEHISKRLDCIQWGRAIRKFKAKF